MVAKSPAGQGRDATRRKEIKGLYTVYSIRKSKKAQDSIRFILEGLLAF